jgi:hypothetical protein
VDAFAGPFALGCGVVRAGTAVLCPGGSGVSSFACDGAPDAAG